MSIGKLCWIKWIWRVWIILKAAVEGVLRVKKIWVTEARIAGHSQSMHQIRNEGHGKFIRTHPIGEPIFI